MIQNEHKHQAHLPYALLEEMCARTSIANDHQGLLPFVRSFFRSQGPYDGEADLSVNCAIASPLLSRFDIILLMLDTRGTVCFVHPLPWWHKVATVVVISWRLYVFDCCFFSHDDFRD